MNLYIILLWIFVIIVIVSTIGYVSYTTYYESQNLGLSTTVIPASTCTKSISDLENLTDTTCCINTDGIVTNLKYDAINDITVAPFPTSWIDVCVGFCDQGATYDRTLNNCSFGNTGSFNKCKTLIEPQNCNGNAMPIAASGTILYYGYSAGNSLCDSCCVCNQQICQQPTICF
jgi:hypothetical protein